jgi:hypothetical protein
MAMLVFLKKLLAGDASSWAMRSSSTGLRLSLSKAYAILFAPSFSKGLVKGVF